MVLAAPGGRGAGAGPLLGGSLGPMPLAAVWKRLSWDHNAFYHRLIVRHLPPGSQRVLDAGCGAGALAGRLAEQVPVVEALDRDPGMVALARGRVPAPVTVRQADLLIDALPESSYDAVVSLSVLHHLPLETVLPRLAAALRPGGRLVAVALPRVDLPSDLPVEVLAAVGHVAVGLVLAIARLAGRPLLVKQDGDMPTAAPTATVDEVREQAGAALPGVRVRRLLFWRYLLVWDRPALHVADSASAPVGTRERLTT